MPLSYSYTLLAPDPSGDAASASSAAARPSTTMAPPAFLGFGLLAPFRRDQKGDFAAGGEEALVIACVAQVLGTESATPTAQGELPWRPDFGSRLYTLRHRNLDDPVTQQIARVYAADALERWEPRFRLQALRLTSRRSRSTVETVDMLLVTLAGAIVRTNVPGNQVVLARARVDLALG